jgi:hypothetical protein
MKKLCAVVLSVSLLSVGASPLNAKGETVRIVVEGADLPKPLDITDPKILVHFNVWAGPGTGSNSPGFNPNAPSFIIDWSQGPLAGIPRGLQRYRVSFYVNYENEKLAYVVFYASDPTTKHGYLYLPGKSDPDYWLNVGTIFRGVEGKWFHAQNVWENIAEPLITKARTPQ